MKIVRRIEATPTRATATPFVILFIFASVILASGCNSGKSAPTPSNFSQAINNHFLDHSDCLFSDTRFPFETSDPEKTRQMDALANAHLLDKSVETSIHVSRYTVTSTGARFAPHFCYGHREVTSIDGSTPLTVNEGFKETTVSYSYTMKEVPVWVLSHDIQAAFPDMARATSSQVTAKATLAQSPVGWQIPD